MGLIHRTSRGVQRCCSWQSGSCCLWPGEAPCLRDPGSFWHVAAGEKTLAAGRVIARDPFSFTRAGRPWVDDQWLANCGMAVVHRLAGWDGLLLATATIWPPYTPGLPHG